MARALVFLAVCVVIAWVLRRVYLAVLQLRVGAVPDDVDVPDIPMFPERGWQLSRAVEAGVATIRVEHPSEGVAREWTIYLREPGARTQLEDTMRRAGLLVRNMSAG